MPARPLLVHYHIFKNAGTSIDRLLAASFGDRWVSFDGEHASDVLTAERVRSHLDTRPQIVALSSHLARPPLPTPGSLPIVMLRHPIDRARSVFDFVRRDPVQYDHPIALRGFAHYVAWVLDNPGVSVSICNYQTIHLSDASFRTASIQDAVATEQDLSTARALLSSWPALGLVRAFEQSCALFETVYKPILPDLQLRDVRENVSPDRPASEHEAIAATREALDQALFERLMAANALDLALYDFARTRFQALVAAHCRPAAASAPRERSWTARLRRLRAWRSSADDRPTGFPDP